MKSIANKKHEPLARDNLGTVVRQSTAADRQVFLERLYGDYEQLQQQRDELLNHKHQLDVDAFQSHEEEIHDLLFSKSDGNESQLGDWDTWERVEALIKRTVYARPSKFSPESQHMKGYQERIETLNKALIDQRIQMNSFNSLLNQQHEEILAWRNLLVLKEREIRTLQSQNNVFSLEMRHAKREVSRIRGTKLIVEEDEIFQDFKLLLAANKELEKENGNLRAKVYDKYGAAGVSSSLPEKLGKEAKEGYRGLQRMEFESRTSKKKYLEEKQETQGGKEDKKEGELVNSSESTPVRVLNSRRSILQNSSDPSTHNGITSTERGFSNLSRNRSRVRSLRDSEFAKNDSITSASASYVGFSTEERKEILSLIDRKDSSSEVSHLSEDLTENVGLQRHSDARGHPKRFQSLRDSTDEDELTLESRENLLYLYDVPNFRKKKRKGRRQSILNRSTGSFERRRMRSSDEFSISFSSTLLSSTERRKTSRRNSSIRRRASILSTENVHNKSSSSRESLGISSAKEQNKKRRKSVTEQSQSFMRSSKDGRAPEQHSLRNGSTPTSGRPEGEEYRPSQLHHHSRQTMRKGSVTKSTIEPRDLRAMKEWKSAMSHATVRPDALRSAIPVSAALVRIKKANMALHRRMEEQCENMMEHFDFDANDLFLNSELHFTVPTFAFSDNGSFTRYPGYHRQENPPTVMRALHVSIASPSKKKSHSLQMSNSKESGFVPRRVEVYDDGDFSNTSGAESSQYASSPLLVKRKPPSPFPVQKLNPVHAQRFSGSRHAALFKLLKPQKKKNEADESVLSSQGPIGVGVSDQNAVSFLSTSQGRAFTATPVPPHSNLIAWNSLKRGVLGIAQLSRAACLKREALHIQQLRQKISFLQKQLDKLGLISDRLELCTPRIEEAQDNQSALSVDEWGAQSTSMNSSSEQENRRENRGGKRSPSDGEVDTDREKVSSSLVFASQQTSATAHGRISATESGYDASSFCMQSSLDENSAFVSSPRGLKKNPQETDKSRKFSTVDNDLVLCRSEMYDFSQILQSETPETNGGNLSFVSPKLQVGENPRIVKGVSVVDRAVGPDRRAETTNEPGLYAMTGSIAQKDKQNEEKGSGKSEWYDKKSNVAAVTEESSLTRREAAPQPHNAAKSSRNMMSYFMAEEKSGSEGSPKLNRTPGVVRGQKINVTTQHLHHVGRRGRVDQEEKVNTKSRDKEQINGTSFYDAFGKLVNSEESSNRSSELFQLLQSELSDLRHSTADIKERHLEMHLEVQQLLSLLQSILSCIDVVVAERVHREINAISSGTINRTGGLQEGGEEARMAAIQSFIREVAENTAHDQVSSLLSRCGIKLNIYNDLNDGKGEKLQDREPQVSGQDGDTSTEKEVEGKNMSENLSNARRRKPHLNVRDLTDDQWVGQYLENAVKDAVKRQVRRGVRPFVSSPVYHYYVGPSGTDTKKERDNDQDSTQSRPSSEYYAEDKYVLVDSEENKIDERAREAEDSSKTRDNFFTSPHIPRMTSDVLNLLLGEDYLRTTPAWFSDEGTIAIGNVSTYSQPSSAIPRHLSLCSLVNRLKTCEGNSDLDESQTEKRANYFGLQRLFQHTVHGERLHIHSQHPLAGLFPALVYDQVTNIDGSWRRIPIGSNVPKIKTDPLFHTAGNSANSASMDLLAAEVNKKKFNQMKSEDVQNMLRELQPHFISARDHIRPKVFAYNFQRRFSDDLHTAKKELNYSLRHVLGDKFADFVQDEVLPIAQKAQEFSTANFPVNTPVRGALRQLRLAEEERQRQHASLLLRRVATNIRMRFLLRRERYQGNAFLGYLEILYRKWRSKQWKKEAENREKAKEMNTQLLETLDLARRPTPYDRPLFLQSKDDLQIRKSRKIGCFGHFQVEKSSFHFEKVHLPNDKVGDLKEEKIKRLHESKKRRKK